MEGMGRNDFSQVGEIGLLGRGEIIGREGRKKRGKETYVKTYNLYILFLFLALRYGISKKI